MVLEYGDGRTLLDEYARGASNRFCEPGGERLGIVVASPVQTDSDAARMAVMDNREGLARLCLKVPTATKPGKPSPGERMPSTAARASSRTSTARTDENGTRTSPWMASTLSVLVRESTSSSPFRVISATPLFPTLV